MPHTLILGYGNPMRGDDGVGWRVVEGLDIPEAEIHALHQLTPEWMEPISRADRVIFIDASTGGTPGEIRQRTIEPKADLASFTHQMTPEALLAGARALYGRAAEGILITVGGEDFGLTSELSETVAATIPQIRALVVALVP